ncbi:cytochrome P450 [Nonomuraea ferruginea]
MLLLVAGHETTVNLIANGVLNLVRHGVLGRAAERPREVVEEVLRYDPPVQLTARVALEDAELGGVRVPAGTSTLALVGAANRDPAAFPDPDRFDVGRAPGRHLAFGLGGALLPGCAAGPAGRGGGAGRAGRGRAGAGAGRRGSAVQGEPGAARPGPAARQAQPPAPVARAGFRGAVSGWA